MLACALTIGGLDPGGGAGIVADLRAFRATGVFGCAVVAVGTVQSTDGLLSSEPVRTALVLRQAEAVVRVQNVRAVKLGALGSTLNVRGLAAWLARTGLPVVLDPVMIPTRGTARLLSRAALNAMRHDLLPTATLVTANALEAGVLTGEPVGTVEEARRAARALIALGARAALVKGGHLEAGKVAVDVLAVGRTVLELRSPRLALPPLHGGGCVLASLIAGRLARTGTSDGPGVEAAVRYARRLHQQALRRAVDVGGAMRVLVP